MFSVDVKTIHDDGTTSDLASVDGLDRAAAVALIEQHLRDAAPGAALDLTVTKDETTTADHAADGRRAIATHPDAAGGQLDTFTLASDTIASILHALEYEASHGEPGDIFDTDELLDHARRCYDGDQEERRP